MRATPLHGRGCRESRGAGTITLTEESGLPTLRILVRHQTRKHRDAHIASGMEDGLQDTLDLLEGVAKSLG